MADLYELFRSASRTPSDRHAIVVEDLAKRYPNGTDAVRGISFRVRAGEVFGLLGPNGAGKSTTMGMLGTLVHPTSGRAVVAGFDVRHQSLDVRRRIGFAIQEVGVDELATGRELLEGTPGDLKAAAGSATLEDVYLRSTAAVAA